MSMADPDTHQSMLDWAQRYTALGWWVFPVHSIRAGRCSCGNRKCERKGKHPRTPRGFQDASTDEAQAKAWWSLWPDANIGIAAGASGLVCIDIDPRHGGDETWRDHKPDRVSLDTAISITGGGGNHVLYKEPTGVPIPTSVGGEKVESPLGPGIDVRARGGYFIAPPSSHESGNEYEWEQSPWDHPPLFLPTWLEEKLAIAPRQQKEPISAAKALDGLSKGERDDYIYRLASKFRHVDLPIDVAYELIERVAEGANPPFERDVAREKVERAYRTFEPGKYAYADPFSMPQGSELFVWAQELDQVPAADWLIEDIMLAESLAEIVGKYGTKKTFIALDMACSLATGRHWHGHEVAEGYVVYIYAEGLRGLRARLRAWEDYHGKTVEKVAFVPRALRLLHDEDVELLVSEILAKVPEKPVAVFVDTVARAMVGGDENKTQDMSTFVYNCDHIRQRTGATVCVIHHNNRAGIDRGNTALPAAVDTQMVAERKDEHVVLKCAKMKDAPEFEPIEFETIANLASIILRDVQPVVTSKPMSERASGLLKLLQKYPDGVAPSKAASDMGMSYKQANRYMKELEELGKTERWGTTSAAVWGLFGHRTSSDIAPDMSGASSDMVGDPLSLERGTHVRSAKREADEEPSDMEEEDEYPGF